MKETIQIIKEGLMQIVSETQGKGDFFWCFTHILDVERLSGLLDKH